MSHNVTTFCGESVFAGSAELLRRGEHSLAILGSGSGSWGCGAKAAAWVVETMSACWRAQLSWRLDVLNDDLDAVIAQLPPQLTSDDFGWSFSLCCVLLSSSGVEYATAGLFGIDIVTATASRQLYRPEMVIDQLVEAGRVEPAAAADLARQLYPNGHSCPTLLARASN